MHFQTYTADDIITLLRIGHRRDVRAILERWQPSDIADLIPLLSHAERTELFRLLPPKQAAETFSFLPLNEQTGMLEAFPSDLAASVLSEMPPDDRTAFLEELPPPIVARLLALLPLTERKIALTLLGYPENSVGRLMTTDYLAIQEGWTAQQAFDYIREYGRESETIDILYIVNEQGILLDDLNLRNLLFVPASYPIRKLLDYKCIALSVDDEDESAVQMFLDNDRGALPVVDKNNILLGMVTIDDVLHLIEEESTEDIQKIGGSEALEEPYMEVPFFELMRKRAGWLTILFIGEMLTASAMAYFEDAIARAVVLALFLPLIISSGGNSGSQASTLIIRALALGEIHLKDWWRVMRREILSGLFLGSILGFIGFLRVGIWSLFTTLYGEHWMLVAVTVGTSLLGIVLWGTLSGAMLPFALKKLGLDPATSSAPFVATLVDVTGVVLYFLIALFVLRGTLL